MGYMEIGELRNQLSLDLQEKVQEIVDKKQNDPNYYIMVFAKPDPLNGNQINTKVFTMYKDRLPDVPLLGTICVYVDNERGKIEHQWCLPLDIPTYGVTDPDSISKEAGVDGQKMGQFIYNN
jgi:hypothetical protein